jgi:hypothetical protein
MATQKLSQEELEFRAKMRALAQGVRVWALEEGERYVCPSQTFDGTAYELLIRDDAISCGCPSAIHRGMCKHIGAVMLRLEVAGELKKDKQEAEHSLEDKVADLR